MINTTLDHQLAAFATDVARDLSLAPKQLQSKYLYDALGSSLFEAICRLPWYRITRAERGLLDRHAPAIVARLCADDGGEPLVPMIVELGCGSGEKIVILAEALQSAGGRGRVHLIDISSQALEQSERTLGRLRHISVVGHRETYEVGLRRAAAARDGDHPMLVLLLGSNIGNFDMPAAHEFLCAIRDALATRCSSARISSSRSATSSSPTTIRSASPRRSTATCSSASTASSAARSTWTRSRTWPSGIRSSTGSKCTSRAAPIST
jgi:uncharacterized SAM-dependent methyltransferase